MSPVQLSLLLAGGAFVAGLFDPVYFLGMAAWLVVAATVKLLRRERRPGLRQLLAETERGASLDDEIQRGWHRRTTD